jgi:ADP-heptose:LPS heptosyltransferase
MRILISNPDTIGDFVLRQPLIASLADAGHELMLIVRASVEPLARQIAPVAHVVVLPVEPYALSVDGPWEPFAAVFDEARSFAPGVLVVAPFRWTLFEERLAAELPSVPRIGLSGNLYRGDPFAGVAPVSTLDFDQIAHVDESDPETTKNAALAALLGRPIRSTAPAIVASPEGVDRARKLLVETGLEPGRFWAACVGGTANVAIKTWPTERWGEALAHWARAHGRRFGFIGVPDEAPTVAAVIGAMGETRARDVAVAAVDLIRPDPSLAMLQGLLALSAGYVGHDTGPMHLAAALGKPVVAVFGQGTWPRFLPAVSPSVAVCMDVPCAGCGWVCAFEQAYCIKSVPVEAVTAAIDDMEAGRIRGQDVRPLAMPPALLARLTRQSAQAAEARLREAAEARKQLAIVTAELAAAEVAAIDKDEPSTSSPPVEPPIEPPVAPPIETVDEQAVAPTAPAPEPPPVSIATSEPNSMPREWPALEPAGPHAGENGHAPPVAEPEAIATPEATPDVVSMEPAEPVVDHAAATEALRAVVAELAATVGRLEQELERRVPIAQPKPPRRPWRQVLVETVIGRQYIAPRGWKKYLPVSIIVPVTHKDEVAAVAVSVESVLRQDYCNREVLIVDDGRNEAVSAYVASLAGQVRAMTLPDGDLAALVGYGFEQSWGQVLAFLRPGVVHANGVVTQAARLFGEKRFVKVAYFQAARDDGAWRIPIGRNRQVDTLDFLTDEPLAYESLFWRRWAYLTVGAIRPTHSAAADWDLAVRTSRMFALHAVETLGPIVPAELESRANTPERAASLAAARRAFLRDFGFLGRARCEVIHRLNALNGWLDGHFIRRRLSFAPPARPVPTIAATEKADEPFVPPAGADRLLFSDVGVHGVRQAYLANATGAVTIIERAGHLAGDDVAGDRATASLYTGHPLRWSRLTATNPPITADATAVDLVREAGIVSSSQSVLDLGGGSAVYPDAFEAPLLVPDGQTFDVVLLGRAMQTAPDAAAMLCRARMLLNPGGLIVLMADNLDSFLVDVYGPTWSGWARGRTLVSLASLAVVAKAAGLRVAWSKTRTPVARAASTVARHRTGLLSSDDATANDDLKIARRLAGWGRALFDWRGRGDEICAVLKE